MTDRGSRIVAVTMGAFLGLCLAAMFAGVGHCSPLDCESIKDPDRRHFCRALSIPRKSECEFIRNKDLRQECRARTTR